MCRTYIVCFLACVWLAQGQSSNDDFAADTECCLTERFWTRREACRLYDCSSEPNAIYWSAVVNMTNGRYRARFSFLEGCQPEHYTATLKVVENVTREQCTANLDFKDSLVHSMGKKLTVKEHGSGNCTRPCDQMGEINFQFIYPGCYQLEIESCFNHSTSMSKSCPEYLESDYRKQLMSDGAKTPVADLKCTQGEATLTINLAGRVWKEVTLIPTTLFVVLLNGTKDVSRWDVKINPDRTVKCAWHNESDPYTHHCKIDRDGFLTVGVSPVLPGTYQFSVQMDYTLDDRCVMGTLWARRPPGIRLCHWVYSNATCEQDKLDRQTELGSGADYLSVIIGGIIFACVLSAVFVFVAFRYFYFRNKIPLIVPVSPHANGLVVSQRPAILLLYSRDCDDFMNLMVSFRVLLKSVTKSEVYDCHDPSQWTDVSLNPTGWMQRLATSKGMRVIVVASRCASLRQQAQLAGDVVRYARQRNTDQLFPYGLQLVTDVTTRATLHAYQTAFVVRFDGFSDDSDLFKVLNSYTRFVLPAHLDTLVSGLQQGTATGKSEPWLDSKEVQKLRSDLEKLVTYKSRYPRYLEDMLVTQKAVYDFGIPLHVRA